MEDKFTIYCDGGARGNPGPAASAFVVEKNRRIIYSDAIYLGKTTNNVAEYRAVIHALEWLVKNTNSLEQEIIFILDSELVARQMNGVYKVKNQNLKKLFSNVASLLQKIQGKIIFKSVSRGKNKSADFLVNQKLDEVS